eukprot:379743_1
MQSSGNVAVNEGSASRSQGGSYIPPHLRGGSEQPAPQPVPQPASNHQNGYQPAPQQQSYQQQQSYPSQRFGGQNRSQGGGRGQGGYQPQQSKWSGDYQPAQNKFRGGGRGGGGYYGGRGGGGGGRPRYNAADRSTEANPRLEQELFDKEGDGVEQGINFDQYDNIPVEVSGENTAPPIANFNEIDNIHPQLLWNIKRCGFTVPTPVQKYAFPIGISGTDLMSCAQTGSGKTAAFLLPMIQQLLESGGAGQSSIQDGYRSIFAPVGIILSPTRELTIQIHKHARKFLYRTGMRACVVYGGASISDQFRDMERGVDVVVATPGRLVDFIERGRLTLTNIRFLILDEADRMLDMGFEPQIRKIVMENGMPPCGPRQTMMFSATFPREIQFLAQSFMKDYVFLAVGRVGSTTESIKQRVEYAENYDKQAMLMRLLPECEGLTLVFVQTKRSADSIEYFLQQQGINATSIHGDRSQREREHALSMFRQGISPVLVATDVASRGLDIPNVKYVFNFDPSRTGIQPGSNPRHQYRCVGRRPRPARLGVAETRQSSDNFIELFVVDFYSPRRRLLTGLRDTQTRLLMKLKNCFLDCGKNSRLRFVLFEVKSYSNKLFLFKNKKK